MNTRAEPLRAKRVGVVMSLLGLMVMLMPLVAFGQSENCPDGFEHKSDPPEDITEEWGTATLVNADTAVEFFVNDGYTVDVCVKGGNEGFTTATIVGEDTEVVSTPTDQEVSHYEWTFTFTPETFDLEVEKVWAGDEVDLEGITVTFDFDPSDTGLLEGDVVTITEVVDGELPEECTYTSSLDEVSPYTVDPEDADDEGVIILTVTNTVDCEEPEVVDTTIPTEVGGTVITTSTTAPAVQVPTTAEVLDTEVEAEELPFTGIDSELLVGMAVLMLMSGLLVLGVTGKREDA